LTTIALAGDIDADMAAIKRFYAPMTGRNATQFEAGRGKASEFGLRVDDGQSISSPEGLRSTGGVGDFRRCPQTRLIGRNT
jgi:hypothetical protein